MAEEVLDVLEREALGEEERRELVAEVVEAAAGSRARGYRTTTNLIAVAYLIVGKLDFATTHST